MNAQHNLTEEAIYEHALYPLKPSETLSEELSHRLHRLSRLTTLPTPLTLLSQNTHFLTHHLTFLTLDPHPNTGHLIFDSLFCPDDFDAAMEFSERWVLEGFDLYDLDRNAMLSFH